MRKKLRFLIFGFFGFHNVGDEAILINLIIELKAAANGMAKNLEICVFSQNPDETSNVFGVESSNRKSPWALIKEIIKSDCVISGGGSLLQDRTSMHSLIYYILLIFAARIFGKKVIAISNGIGPLDRKMSRFLVKVAVNSMEFVTVRDSHSAGLLREIGVREEKIYLSADLVMEMSEESPARGFEILERLGLPTFRDSSPGLGTSTPNRPKIAIAVREKDFRDNDRLKKMADLVKSLSAHYYVVFLPFYYKNDTKLKKALAPLLNGYEYYFLSEKYGPKDFMSLVGCFDLLIGSRLHSLIFALVAGTLSIGISYDPKVTHFLTDMNKEEVCNIQNFDDKKIYNEVRRILTDPKVIELERQDMISNRRELKSKIQRNRELTHELFKKFR